MVEIDIAHVHVRKALLSCNWSISIATAALPSRAF